MKINRKMISLLAAAALTTSSFTACATAEPEKTNKITLAVYPLMSPYFEYAIEELGIYDEYGVDVELVEFAQYPDVITALDTGSVDASIVGITEVVAPITSKLDLAIVAMTDYSSGMDGIVARPGIDSVEDLAGKTIATNIGSMNHMLLLSALESAGLSESDVNIINMTEGDSTAALVGGSIDAASIFEPQMSEAVEQSGGSIIFDSGDIAGELSDILMVKQSLIDENPESVQALVDAWFAMQKQYPEDTDAVMDIISKKSAISNDELYGYMAGLDMTTVDYNKELFANDNETMIELVEKVAGFLFGQDLVKEVPTKEQIGAYIDNSFINGVK